MCLTITKQQAIVLTATEDIVVYKVAIENNGQYVSYYEKFPYRRHSEMYAKDFSETVNAIDNLRNMGFDCGALDLVYGFHSFLKLENARKFLQDELKAIAACRYILSIYRNPKLVLLKFVVPANSRYVLGTFSLGFLSDKFENILSEKLKFVELLDT